jgi:hypothetical protein
MFRSLLKSGSNFCWLLLVSAFLNDHKMSYNFFLINTFRFLDSQPTNIPCLSLHIKGRKVTLNYNYQTFGSSGEKQSTYPSSDSKMPSLCWLILLDAKMFYVRFKPSFPNELHPIDMLLQY